MRILVLKLFGSFFALLAILILASHAQERLSSVKKNCSDFYFGPYHYSEFKDVPLNIKFGGCIDGSAWTDRFHFQSKAFMTVTDLQKTINIAINSKTDTCKGREYSAIVTNPRINSTDFVDKKQNAVIDADVKIKMCRFPYLSAQLIVTVPMQINISTFHATLSEPVTRANGPISSVADYIPSMKLYINETAKGYIKPYFDAFSKTLEENEVRMKIYRLAITSIKISTNDNILTADFSMEASLMKSFVEGGTGEWLRSQGIK